MKKHRTNRILALLLVLVMALSLFPADALAEEEEAEPAVAEEIVETVVPEIDAAVPAEEPALDASTEDEPAAADDEPDTVAEDDPADLPDEEPTAASEDDLIPEVPATDEEIDVLSSEDNEGDEPDAEPPAAGDADVEEPSEDESVDAFLSTQGVALLGAEGDDPAVIAAGTCGANGDNLTWTLAADGTLTISGTGEMDSFSFTGDEKAPWYTYRVQIQNAIVEPGVTCIGKYAFYDCASLTSIIIPETVISIRDFAFNKCICLSSVSIPDGVTSIGGGAFSGCTSLISVIIPKGVTEIDTMTFNDCSNLASISIPDDVNRIGSKAFQGCSNLIDVSIPDGVITVEFNAFYACSNLSILTIPESINYIGEDAFSGCISLVNVYFKGTRSQWEALTVKPGNAPLLNATISCEGGLAAGKCGTNGDNLTWRLTEDGVLTIQGEWGMKNYFSPTNQNPTNLAPWFDFCDQIINIVITPGVTSIGNCAFWGCNNLTSIVIPEGVTEIGSSAFSDCCNLPNIIIPEGVTYIGSSAFSGCSNLSSITIPISLTTIVSGVFKECDYLLDVNYNGTDGWWECIDIQANNDPILAATIHYFPNESPIVVISDWCSNGLKWTLYSDGLLKIHGTGQMINYTSSTLDPPWYRFRKQIKRLIIEPGASGIGYRAFSGCKNLTSVLIPETITSIGQYAFQSCSSLTEITIPDGVISVGNCAFCDCSGLTSVTLPNSLTSIGKSAFADCISLTSISIPNNVTNISENSFRGCSSLVCVSLPNSLSSIGNEAFSSCISLTSIAIPKSTTSIGGYAFAWCDSLTFIRFEHGEENSLTFSDHPFLYSNTGNLATIVCVPDSNPESINTTIFSYHWVEEGRDVSFFSESSLPIFGKYEQMTYQLLDGKITITSCDSSVCGEVEIPAMIDGYPVVAVADSAFSSCVSLSDVRYLGTRSQWGKITIGANNDPLLYANIHFTLSIIASGECGSSLYWTLDDEGTLTIRGTGEMYYYHPWLDYSDQITSLVIEPGVTSIGSNAFQSCDQLANVTLPSTITCIDEYAFGRCRSLTSIVVPEGVTFVGEYAFTDCSSLTSISIPDSVTSIGYAAFCDCSGLKSISLPLSITSIEDSTFAWCNSLSSIVIPESVKSIGKCAFSQCSSLTNITIPDSVLSIGDLAFSDCSSLVNITIPDGVTSIGYEVFCRCSSLTSINIPDNVTSIGDWAFYRCSSLQSISIPDSVTSIGECAFLGCSSLSSVTLSEGLAIIAESSFSECSNLTGVILPESVTKIGECAFLLCESLTSITIPDGVKQIEVGAFSGCSNLISVSIPNSVTDIGDYAFNGCHSLSSITIPTSTTCVGEFAFSMCYSLTSITIPESVIELGIEAFSECYDLKHIQFTGNVPSIASNTFAGIIADAYYPADADWQPENLLDYGGKLTWKVAQLDTPVLVSAANDIGGVTVKWGSVDGAKKYRVFRKTGTGSWKAIADTTETSFTDTTAVSGTKYTYTVRCVTADGSAYASAYDKTGKAVTYVAAPVVTSLTSVNGGVQIKWTASKGAGKYRVFRRTETGSWAKVSDATATSFTDKTAVAGTTYYYTVRCMNSTAKAYTSAYDETGWSTTYIAAPVLVSAANDVGGVTVKWNTSSGAELYRVFRKTGSGSWKAIADTAETSYLDTTAASGTKYTYTVRCVSADGATYISGYNTTGKSVTYIAAPVVTNITSVSGGVKIQWAASTGAAKYRVFRRTETGSWTKLGDTTATSYTDKTAAAGTTYYYTVRCMNSTAKAYTSAYDPFGTPGSRG